MTFGAGTVVGDRYMLLQVLGSGGMATVYRAQSVLDPAFQVALKVFHPGILRSAEAKERYRTEILAAYRVPHANVIQVYEFFDEGDLFAFAMEYADNGDLFTKMQLGPRPESEVLDVLFQVASGLAAVHEAAIIHRDLKPENIMLFKSGLVKLGDFGVARLGGSHTPTQSGRIVGTPRYVAPEYVVTGTCDSRGDIFALGFIAFEMLSKRYPYPEHNGEVLSRRRYDPALRTYLQQCFVDFSPELELIIERCLALAPQVRYQSALEICEDIEHLRNGEALTPSTQAFAKKRQIFSAGDIRTFSSEYYASEAGKPNPSLAWVSVLNLILCFFLLFFLIFQN